MQMNNSFAKSDLIDALANSPSYLVHKNVVLAVNGLLEEMSQALASGNRIEVRGFVSFSLHYRSARMGRNPKSGDSIALCGKFVPHFKLGKELRAQVAAPPIVLPIENAQHQYS